MKRILFLCFILVTFLDVQAQKDQHREKIKALKTAYITQGLNLTSEEAQKFWPVYNEYTNKKRSLYRKEHEDIGDLECITEEQANQMLKDFVQLENQDYLLKKQFFEDLKQIFSAKRILLLEQVEDEFNEKMIREYRERHRKS